jgi:hypothetical protein
MRISCKHFKNKRKRKAAGGNTHRIHSKVDYREIEMPRVVLHLVSRRRDSCSYSFLDKELGFI